MCNARVKQRGTMGREGINMSEGNYMYTVSYLKKKKKRIAAFPGRSGTI